MNSNTKKIVVVGLLMSVCTAIFMFWYGKVYQANADKPYRDSLTTVNGQLQGDIKARDTTIAGIQSRYIDVLNRLKQNKVEYVNINKKYDKMDSVVRVMPIDDQVRFLANWLPQSDTIGR